MTKSLIATGITTLLTIFLMSSAHAVSFHHAAILSPTHIIAIQSNQVV